MLTSREKSGHLAPPSGMQKRFAQFSRQAQTAQLCRAIINLDKVYHRVKQTVVDGGLFFCRRKLVDDFVASHQAKVPAGDAFEVAAVGF